MPVNAVKTAARERLWKKAKARAAAQGHALDYAYVMGIYQRMLGEPVEKAMMGAPQFAGWQIPGQVPRGLRDEQVELARQQAQDALRLATTPPTQAAAERASARPMLTPQAVVKDLGLDLAVGQRLSRLVDGLTTGQGDELKFRQAWMACLVDGEPGLDPVARQQLGERGLALWRSRAEQRETPMAGELRITVPRERKLEKAMLFIGPRGGRWADAAHPIPWDDKVHGKPKVVIHDKTEDPEEQAEPAPRAESQLTPEERAALESLQAGPVKHPSPAVKVTLGKLFARGLVSLGDAGFALTPAGEQAVKPAKAAPASPAAPVAEPFAGKPRLSRAEVDALPVGSKIVTPNGKFHAERISADKWRTTNDDATPGSFVHITTAHHSRVLPGEDAAGKQNHVGWRLEAAAPAPAPVKLELAAGQTARMATRAEVEAAAPPAPAELTGQEIKAAPEGARINVRGKDGLKATLVKQGDSWYYETAAGPVGDYGTQTVLDILQGIREEGGESEPGWARMPEGKDKPTPPAVTVPAGPAKARAAKTAPPQLGLFSSATTAKVQEARERAQQVAKKAAETGKPVPQAALDLQEQALAELKDREVDAQAATVARRVRGLESKRSPVEIKAEAGEHVWGSRKDLAALVHSADDLAKLTPEEQSKLVTKARLVEPWEAEDLLAEGWEPQAVLARHAIEACIAPAAGDSLEARQAYMNGVDYWAHTFDACRTFQDVQEALVDLNRLTDGRVELASMEKPELDTLLWKYAEHEAQRAGKTLAPRAQIQALSTAYDAASSIYRDLHNTVQAQINEYKRQFWTEYTHEKRNPSSADFWERWVVKKPLPPELVAGQEKVAALEAAKKRAYQALQDAGGDLIMRADESAAVAWANGLPSGDVGGMHIRAADGSYSMKFYKRDAKLAEAGWKVGGNQYQQMVAALGERMVRLVNSGQGGGGGWSSFQEKATPKAWLDVLATVKAMRKPKEKGGPAPTAEDHVQMMHEHLKSKKRGGGKGGPGWLRDVPDTVVRKGGRELGKSTPAEIAREFGLKNVQFGNWVSEEDAKVHVPAAHAAFADLQDLLGADSPGQVSMNGRLSLGIGARGSGNARAHYETQGEIINLTKISGGGALAHEWAHALDNLLSKAGNPESTQAHRFVSDGQDKGVDPVVAKAFHVAVQEILQGEFYQDAKAMGSAYWRRPHEMFARAFEAWAEDELARRGQENSYLVAGTRKVYQTRKFASQADAAKGRSAQPYPQGAKRAAIGEKIGALVAALRETGALKKALEALDARAHAGIPGLFYNGRVILMPGVYREGEPRLLVPAGELQKAGGPYIGPKGGKWEDPKHTRHWDPQEHQGGAAQGDLFGEKKPEPKLEVPATQPEPPALTVPADQPAALPARTLDTMSDAIALGSPSGRQSQASQQAAQARLGEALFGPGGLKAPQQAQPSKVEVLRRQAADLRKLAAQGVQPRKHKAAAEKLEAAADEIEGLAAGPGTEKFDRAVIRAEKDFREWAGASGSVFEKRGDELAKQLQQAPVQEWPKLAHQARDAYEQALLHWDAAAAWKADPNHASSRVLLGLFRVRNAKGRTPPKAESTDILWHMNPVEVERLQDAAQTHMLRVRAKIDQVLSRLNATPEVDQAEDHARSAVESKHVAERMAIRDKYKGREVMKQIGGEVHTVPHPEETAQLEALEPQQAAEHREALAPGSYLRKRGENARPAELAQLAGQSASHFRRAAEWLEKQGKPSAARVRALAEKFEKLAAEHHGAGGAEPVTSTVSSSAPVSAVNVPAAASGKERLRLSIEKAKGYSGKKSGKSYIAKITGKDGQFGMRREFLDASEVDWGDSELYRKSKGIRTEHHDLEPGLYERQQYGEREHLAVYFDKAQGKLRWVRMDEARAKAIASLMHDGVVFEDARQQTKPAVKKSLALLVPLDRLEKSDPRGGKYVKRAPRPGGQGYRYYYSEKGYERATGHVDGQRAADQHLGKRVVTLLNKAGPAGLHPRRLAELVRQHGRQRVAGVLKATGCRFDKGRFYPKTRGGRC